MPDTIQFGTGNQTINKYAANGQKLSTEYYTKISPLLQPLVTGEVYNWKANPGEMEKTSTLYIGNFEYETSKYDWNTPVLNRISNNEGYVNNFNVPMQDVRYNYYRRDHLGNNREVWYASYNKWERNADQMGYHTVSIPSATSQQTQYYPSGLPWAEGMGQDVQTRKYNGKEFVGMHGYDTYDYGARGYYAASGRWTSVDPLAEKYYSISPYAYCAGNPVRFIDPDGMDIDVTNLTDNKSVAALYEIIKNAAGRKFLMQYLAKGQGLKFTFGGKSQNFVAKEDGEFSNNTLSIKSTVIPNSFDTEGNNYETHGMNEEYEKNGSTLIEDDKNYDVRKGMNFSITINMDGRSVNDKINTTLHELFVHNERDLNRLNTMINDLNNGSLKIGTRSYFKRLEGFTDPNGDHTRLGNGQVTNYKKASTQIDLSRGLSNQLKKYNEDVKAQK